MSSPGLNAMTSRHMMMISIGAMIGTGLFLNSGYTPVPPVRENHTLYFRCLHYVVSHGLSGRTFRCHAGIRIIQEFSHQLISPAAGHAIGWLYWFCWVLCIAWYLSAVGIYMQYWMPVFPLKSGIWYSAYCYFYLIACHQKTLVKVNSGLPASKLSPL